MVSQRAFLRNFARGEAYLQEAPTLWDVTFQTAVAQAELEARDYAGHYHRVAFHRPDGSPVHVETTRPELIPAVVALIAHPDDERYQALFGTHRHLARCSASRSRCSRTTPPSPTRAPASRCAARSATSPTSRGGASSHLPVRTVIGRDGRLHRETPEWLAERAAATAYAELAGKTAFSRPRGDGRPAARVRRPRRRAHARPSGWRTSTRRARSRSRSSPPASGTSATAAATPTCATR